MSDAEVEAVSEGGKVWTTADDALAGFDSLELKKIKPLPTTSTPIIMYLAVGLVSFQSSLNFSRNFMAVPPCPWKQAPQFRYVDWVVTGAMDKWRQLELWGRQILVHAT